MTFLDIALRQSDYPLDESVVCMRADNANSVAKTNVPHLIVRHSPDGYEWGYGGSGPSELALNICEYYIRILKNEGHDVGEQKPLSAPARGNVHEATYKVYQYFKGDFLVMMPHEGGTILSNLIMIWLKDKLGLG